MTMEDDEELGGIKEIAASIRSAKKSAKPSKIGDPESKPAGKDKKKKGKKAKVTGTKGSSFESELGSRKKASTREGVRAKKGDKIGAAHKKGKGKTKAKS